MEVQGMHLLLYYLQWAKKSKDLNLPALKEMETKIFSFCFNRFCSLTFYAILLQRVLSFARAFDEKGTAEAREQVWQRYASLIENADLLKPLTKQNNFFSPMITQCLHQPTINLFNLELLFVAFLASTACSLEPIPPRDAKVEEDDLPPSIFTPWGNTLPAILCQLSLVSSFPFRAFSDMHIGAW